MSDLKRIKKLERYSTSKGEWVKIKEMPKEYIVNALRIKVNSKKATELVEDEEFISLVLNLAKKFRDELKEEEEYEGMLFGCPHVTR